MTELVVVMTNQLIYIQMTKDEKLEIKKAKLEWRAEMRAKYPGWTKKRGLKVIKS